MIGLWSCESPSSPEERESRQDYMLRDDTGCMSSSVPPVCARNTHFIIDNKSGARVATADLLHGPFIRGLAKIPDRRSLLDAR